MEAGAGAEPRTRKPGQSAHAGGGISLSHVCGCHGFFGPEIVNLDLQNSSQIRALKGGAPEQFSIAARGAEQEGRGPEVLGPLRGLGIRPLVSVIRCLANPFPEAP